MRPRFIISCVLLACGAATLGIRCAGAGNFVLALRCDTLGTAPARVRLQFEFVNPNSWGPLCRATFTPASYPGSPLRPIIAAESPTTIANGDGTFSRMAVSVDSLTGVATYTATPCLPRWWAQVPDSLALIVSAEPAGGLPVYFVASMYTTGGALVEGVSEGWICRDTATPVSRSTWGRLKIMYR